MVNNEMTIIDNSGLLDPRVRKFLALAGLCLKIVNANNKSCLEQVNLRIHSVDDQGSKF